MNTKDFYNKYSRKSSWINRFQCFIRSNIGFKIAIILISLVFMALIEFGLIVGLFLGELLDNDFLISWSKQKLIFLNINEGLINESTNQCIEFFLLSLIFRCGFLLLLFGIIIGFLNIKTNSQSIFQSKKRQKYFSLMLIFFGVLLLVFTFFSI